MTNREGYKHYCPIALTSQILCKRWTTLILRAFVLGATSYNEIIKSAPAISPTLLSNRLTELESANIIQEIPNDKTRGKLYQLTTSGQALFPILDQMGIWAQDWLRHEVTEKVNLNPDALMWEVRQSIINHHFVSDKLKVAQFNLSGVPANKQHYWLVFDADDIDICVKDPGHDIDIWISADIQTLVEIWLGHIRLSAAIANRSLKLDGYTHEVKAFSHWFGLSHFSAMALKNSP